MSVTYQREILQAIVTCLYENSDAELERYFINDGRHYMLMQTGWLTMQRVCSPALYVRLEDGKIWIERDDLYTGFATRLWEAGVPHEDVVLAYHHPQVRQLIADG